MGFCGTMGADYIDYIIADNYVIPPHLRGFYNEKVIAMPHTYFVNDHKQSSQHLLKPSVNTFAPIAENHSSNGENTEESEIKEDEDPILSAIKETNSTNTMLTRAKYGISDDKFVFCNFNQLYKIDPEIFDVWMNILKRLPNAVLWLLRFPDSGEQNILSEAKKRGIRKDQIIFSDVVNRDEHIRRGYLADLFLDTPLYNAHTTACDIL